MKVAEREGSTASENRAQAGSTSLIPFARQLWIGVAVLNLLVAAIVASALYASWHSHVERARTVTQNLSLILERHIGNALDNVDLALKNLAGEYTDRIGSGSFRAEEWNALIARQRSYLPILEGIRGTDVRGLTVYGRLESDPQGVSIADRDYFKAHRDAPDSGLLISPPTFSRISQRWSLILSRRVNARDGTFDGVLVATIPLEHFSRLFALLKVGERGSIGLRDGELRLIARHPALGNGGQIGSARVAQEFRDALREDRAMGSFHAAASTSVDGVQRFYSYRRSAKHPFYVIVGVADEELLAPWQGELLRAGAVLVLFLLVTVILARRLQAAVAKVQALNADLEKRVAERTEKLELALRDLESFSYSTSHDLRTPLRAINGFAKVLVDSERNNLTEQGRHLLDRIAQAAVRLGRLIDDVLEYSRLGRAPMRPESVDLNPLCRTVVDELRAAYPGTQIVLGDLPVVCGDPTMLLQILQNLVGNACKFTAAVAQPHVEIGVQERAGIREICVRDNGAGFDMAHAQKLFGMFQRLHAESEFPGSGVGLAIVKRLVERHGGTIRAESEPGKGAAFYFTLGEPA